MAECLKMARLVLDRGLVMIPFWGVTEVEWARGRGRDNEGDGGVRPPSVEGGRGGSDLAGEARATLAGV